nr:Lbx1 transcription factor [Mus musculus]
MTSKEDGKAAPGEERRRSPLDHLPPPANSNKPYAVQHRGHPQQAVRAEKLLAVWGGAPAGGRGQARAGRLALAGRALLSQTSPLCALEELASKTFKGLEVSVLQAAEGRDGMTIFGQRQTPKKRRKSRTAFTNHQIYELEKRFLYQKYLSPADRDQIAQQLGLTNAQVITWFQNRRAKLKRDLEEMKADVESAKKLGPSGQMDIVALAELEQNSEASGGGGGGCGRAKSRPGSPALPPGAPQAPGGGPLQLSPASPLTDQRASSQDCSEDEEDEEIDVDD